MKEKILRPTFYNSFSCVASECKDSCCKGWEIQIDRKTYKKYEEMKSSSFKREVLDSVELKDKEDAFGYGRFKLNNGSCQMLSQEGLCQIHKELGESYLCQTCSMYPRSILSVGDILEFSLSMSCPEVTKIALAEKDGIEFELVEDTVGSILIRALKISDNKENKLNYLPEIRNFIISILQERSFLIESRLMVVGLLLEQLDDVDPSQIPFVINSFAEEMKKDDISSLFRVEYDAMLAVSIGSEIFSSFFKDGLIASKFFTVCLNALNGYKKDGKYSVHDAINRYQQGKELYYDSLLKDHEYMIENFLVMLVYSKMFPRGFKTYKEAFRALVGKYLIIKFTLIGNALNKEEMTLEDIVECAYSYYREVEHGEEVTKVVLEILDKYKVEGLNELYALIKG